MYYLTKSFTFDAAHHLEQYEGKCASKHGHTYHVFVKLAVKELQSNGIAVDFGDIKKAYRDYIHDVYDHKDLNTCAPFSTIVEHPETAQMFNPTAENMCRIFYNILKPSLPDLFSVTVYETPTSFCEYVEDTDQSRVQK